MQEKLWKVMLVYSILFSAAAMYVMLYFSATKTIVIAEETTPGHIESEVQGDKMIESPLFFREEGAEEGIRVPLPPEIRADDIVIENRYIEHGIYIILTGSYRDFYVNNVLIGKDPKVIGGTVGEEAGVTRLQLQLTEPCEQEYIFENGMLYLTFTSPGNLYDKILVLDITGGSSAGNGKGDVLEADIILELSEKITEKLKDSDIHVYCTRTDDREVTEEEKIKFVNDLQADMLISIRTVAKENSDSVAGIQAVYNRTYFIPYFGNTELADMLVRYACVTSGCVANGLYEAESDDILLQRMQIPAAAIVVDCLTNKKEVQLLSSEEHKEKLAEGIAEGIVAAFAEKDKSH